MVSPSQRAFQKNFVQVYYDRRLQDILSFIAKHKAISYKDLASLGLAKVCGELIEQLESSTSDDPDIIKHKMAARIIETEYQHILKIPCPIAECFPTAQEIEDAQNERDRKKRHDYQRASYGW